MLVVCLELAYGIAQCVDCARRGHFLFPVYTACGIQNS